MRSIILLLFTFVALCGNNHSLVAQNLTYGVQLDTTQMTIGDQQHFKFVVKGIKDMYVTFPQLKDTLTYGVEILSGPKRDSIPHKDGSWDIEESYVITVFDTGVYYIPSMPIYLLNNGYNNAAYTEKIGFYVNTFDVDMEKGIFDIVEIKKIPWTLQEIIPFVLWTLGIIAFILLCIWVYFRYKKHKSLFGSKVEVVPPYDIAMKSLNKIKDEKLWQSGNVKHYYTLLTDTVRCYLSGELGVSAVEQTSAETLSDVKKCDVMDDATISKLTDLLETSDFVKFAKYTPMENQNVSYLDLSFDVINSTNVKLQERKKKEEAEAKEAEVDTEIDKSGVKKQN